MPFTEILQTSCGAMIVHKNDTSQTSTLRNSGRPLASREIDALRPYINSETTFLDIGSNVGCFALSFAPIAKKVVAFEAQRIFANMIAGSVALNSYMNVWVYNLAMSDTLEQIPIPQFDHNQMMSWGSVEFGAEQREYIGQQRQPNTTEMVLANSLDALVERLPELNVIDNLVIKIDVEGMEAKVLVGGEKTISKYRPPMLIEYAKSDKGYLAGWLNEHGYNLVDMGMDFFCVPR